ASRLAVRIAREDVVELSFALGGEGKTHGVSFSGGLRLPKNSVFPPRAGGKLVAAPAWCQAHGVVRGATSSNATLPGSVRGGDGDQSSRDAATLERSGATCVGSRAPRGNRSPLQINDRRRPCSVRTAARKTTIPRRAATVAVLAWRRVEVPRSSRARWSCRR